MDNSKDDGMETKLSSSSEQQDKGLRQDQLVSEPASEVLPSLDEYERDFARKFWKTLFPQADEEELQDFSRWAQGSEYMRMVADLARSSESTASREGAAPGEDPFVGAMEGSPPEVMVALMREVELGGPETARRQLRERLLPTLRLWERDRVGSAENRIDMVLQVVSRAVPSPPCTRAFGDLVAGMRSYLVRFQRPTERSADWLLSWASISDLVGRGRQRPCREQSAFYYHEVLSVLCQEPAWIEENPRLVRVQAANLAGHIIAMGGQQTVEQTPRIGVVVNRVHRLAALAGKPPDHEGGRRAAYWLHRSLGLLEGEAKVEEGAVMRAHIVASMMDVPTAWFFLYEPADDPDASMSSGVGPDSWGRPHVSYTSLVAGMIRPFMVTPEDRDEVAQGFFNAAVNISKSDPSGAPGANDVAEWAVMAFATTGLWWALVLGRDLQEALGPFHGGDCAALLYGHLTRDWLQPGFRTLAGQLGGKGSALPDNAAYRLGRAWENLGLEPASGQEAADLATLRETVHESLGYLLALQGVKWIEGLPEGPIPDDERMEQLVGAMHEVMDAWMGRETREAAAVELGELLSRLAVEARDLPDTVRRYYGGLAGDPIAGETLVSRAGRGPLVEAGVMSKEEWDALANRSVRPSHSVDSIAALLEEHMGWLT
ncbi:MAG: hypothetical protein ACQEXJ_14640 [Myxococcota bacterium]